MTAPSLALNSSNICSGSQGSESAGTSSMDNSNGTTFSGTPEPKGSTCSRLEINYPTIHNPDNLYDSKQHRKLIRFVTVIAYMFAVSLAAIVLSLYYFFLWDPNMPPAGSFGEHMAGGVGGHLGANSAFFPTDGFRGGRKRIALHAMPQARPVTVFAPQQQQPPQYPQYSQPPMVRSSFEDYYSVQHQQQQQQQQQQQHPTSASLQPPALSTKIFPAEAAVALASTSASTAESTMVTSTIAGNGGDSSTSSPRQRPTSQEDEAAPRQSPPGRSKTDSSGSSSDTSSKAAQGESLPTPLALWVLRRRPSMLEAGNDGIDKPPQQSANKASELGRNSPESRGTSTTVDSVSPPLAAVTKEDHPSSGMPYNALAGSEQSRSFSAPTTSTKSMAVNTAASTTLVISGTQEPAEELASRGEMPMAVNTTSST